MSLIGSTVRDVTKSISAVYFMLAAGAVLAKKDVIHAGDAKAMSKISVRAEHTHNTHTHTHTHTHYLSLFTVAVNVGSGLIDPVRMLVLTRPPCFCAQWFRST